jgi:acetyl esterase/lipase
MAIIDYEYQVAVGGDDSDYTVNAGFSSTSNVLMIGNHGNANFQGFGLMRWQVPADFDPDDIEEVLLSGVPNNNYSPWRFRIRFETGSAAVGASSGANRPDNRFNNAPTTNQVDIDQNVTIGTRYEFDITAGVKAVLTQGGWTLGTDYLGICFGISGAGGNTRGQLRSRDQGTLAQRPKLIIKVNVDTSPVEIDWEGEAQDNQNVDGIHQSYYRTAGVSYHDSIGNDTRRELDIITPADKEAPPGGRAVFFFIHGGAFAGGSKNDLTANGGRSMLWDAMSRNMVAVPISYKLVAGNVFFDTNDGWTMPSMIQDSFAALKFIKTAAATYDMNPEKVVVVGYSAGGYLATALAIARQDPDRENKVLAHRGESTSLGSRYGDHPNYYVAEQRNMADIPTVKALMSIGGPMDLMKVWDLNAFIRTFISLGYNRKPNATKPISLINGEGILDAYIEARSGTMYENDAPVVPDFPIGMMHATGDTTVPTSTTLDPLYDALDEVNYDVSQAANGVVAEGVALSVWGGAVSGNGGGHDNLGFSYNRTFFQGWLDEVLSQMPDTETASHGTDTYIEEDTGGIELVPGTLAHSPGYNNGITITHNATGDNRLAVVVVYCRHMENDVTGVTYDGVAMTASAESIGGSTTRAARIYTLVNPPTGTVDVVLSLSAFRRFSISVCSFANVDQSTAIEATSSANTGFGATATANITTITDNAWVVDGVQTQDDRDMTPGSGQVEIEQEDHPASDQGTAGTSYKIMPTAGATSTTWTWSTSNNWAIASVAIRPFDSDAPTTETEEHSTDTFIEVLATETETHSTDSLIVESQTATHGTDTLIEVLATETESHSSDTLIVEGQTESHSGDTLILEGLSAVQNTDTNVIESLSDSHATDTLLIAQETTTHLSDTFVQDSLSVSQDLDALVIAEQSSSQSLDTNVVEQGSQAHATDTLIEELNTETESHTTDSLVIDSATSTHSSDALLKDSSSEEHQTDTLINAAATASHSTDSFVAIIGDYSREDITPLPTDNANLDTLYDATDKATVSTLDGNRVDVSGTSFLIHQFKDPHNAGTWTGRSTLAPSSSTVYFQAYNHDTEEWVTLDYDDSTAADTDFTLTGNVNFTDYLDAGGLVSYRVYQGVA